MASYLDFDPEPDLNEQPPPQGAPEGNYAGKWVNDTFRYMMAAVRRLGDSALHRGAGTSPGAVAGTMAMQNANTVAITGGTIGDGVAGAVPLKGLMWFGGTFAEAEALQPRWAICDGRTVNGITTPNLVSRFLVTPSTSSAPGTFGGSLSPTTTGPGGSHNHGGAAMFHSITVAQLPPHEHGYRVRHFSTAGSVVMTRASSAMSGGPGTEAFPLTTPVGLGHGHNHGIPNEGSHSHTVNVNPPPNYVAILLMRTA